jgi:hypothetical protein
MLIKLNLQMSMKIKICISSHIKSYEKTYPIIVDSLIKSGVPPEDIYFFIGGYDRYYNISKDGINIYKVNHNSMDLTNIISILDIGLESDYWFAIHDTCYVGDNFYNKLTSYNIITDTVLLTGTGVSMNMGTYKHNYLLSIKDQLLKIKNESNSPEDILRLKKYLIRYEDLFLKDKGQSYNISPHITTHSTHNIYETTTERILQYFPDIDFYKLKANWGQSQNNTLDL